MANEFSSPTFAMLKSKVAPTEERITEATEAWLEENVDPESGYVLDRTLEMSNAAAPADKVGELKTDLNIVNQSGTLTVKVSGATILPNKTIVNPYASTNICGPIQVQKGDVVSVTNINCNSALAALSYSDENVTTIYDVIEVGKGGSLSNVYTTTADRDGYIAVVTSSAASTPSPTYTQERFGLKTTYDNKISALEAEMEQNLVSAYIDSAESTNVFDPDDVTGGVLVNGYGNEEANTSTVATGYYEVKSGDIIRFTPYTINYAQSIFVFDSDKNVLATGLYPRTDNADYSQITIPSNGKYFRFNIYFRKFTETVITINQPFSKTLAGKFGKYIAIKPDITYESNLYNKFISYNGDSICEGRYNGTNANGGAYPNLISRITGSRAENRAIGGGILASAVGDGGQTPERCVVNDIINMSEDADVVCIEGGYNDYARDVPLGTMTAESDLTGTVDTTTICGALESIFRQAKVKWLGKPIVFVIVHKVQNSWYTNNTASTPYNFKDVHDACVQICNKYAIPYYDASLYSGLNGHDAGQSSAFLTANATGTADGTHPNEAGYRRYYVPQLIKLFESVMPVLVTE